MPRIPVILATQGVAAPEGPRIPYAAGTNNIGAAVTQTANAVAGVAQEMAAAEYRQRVAGAHVETDAAISTLKDDYDKERQRLIALGEPEKFSQRANDAFDNLSQQAASSLRYEESRALYQKKVNELQSQESIKARAEGIRLQHATTNAAAGLLDREDANTAVFGTTPEERKDALTRMTQRDAQLVATGARAASHLPVVYAEMDEAMARRDFDDPSKRNQVIVNLTAGRYAFLPGDKQLTLRDTLVNKAQQDRDAQRKEEAAIRKDLADEAERGIVDTVRKKDYAQSQELLNRYGQYMSGEEKKTWQDYITKAQTTKESDSNIRQALSVMVYTADRQPLINEARKAVIRAVGAGLLASPDDEKFLTHLQGMARADTNRAEDKALDAYHRVRSTVHEQLKEDLRVAGPLDKFVPMAQQTYSMALDDYNRNVPIENASGEDPRAWYKRTKAEWIARLSTAATARIATLEQGLDVFVKDSSAIEAEIVKYQAQGKPLPEGLKDVIRRLKEADEIRREVQRLQAKPLDTEQGQKPAEEKTSGGGGKSLGYK